MLWAAVFDGMIVANIHHVDIDDTDTQCDMSLAKPHASFTAAGTHDDSVEVQTPRLALKPRVQGLEGLQATLVWRWRTGWQSWRREHRRRVFGQSVVGLLFAVSHFSLPG